MAELIARDTQGWARLMGLLSQLALPSRPAIEIEVAPDTWVVVDSLVIERDALVLISSCGTAYQEFRFMRGEPIPCWRHGAQAR